jgi:hypothetical protein
MLKIYMPKISGKKLYKYMHLNYPQAMGRLTAAGHYLFQNTQTTMKLLQTHSSVKEKGPSRACEEWVSFPIAYGTA